MQTPNYEADIFRKTLSLELRRGGWKKSVLSNACLSLLLWINWQRDP